MADLNMRLKLHVEVVKMKYKLVYTRLQSVAESKTRSNAFRSSFWRTSLRYPSRW